MNNKSILTKESIYIDLSDHNIITINILTINNVLLIKIKINTFLVKMIYRIVQKKTIIKVFDFTKTITFMITIINHLFRQDFCFHQDLRQIFFIKIMLINLNNYNNIKLINYNNKVNHRLTNYHYKS